MQQESIILFVDLETKAKNYSATLASQGMKVASVSLAEAEVGITQGLPRAIIAPEEATHAIAKILKNSELPLEIPFFTLGTVGMASQPSLPREVTARLPRDIDAGVLCLRLSTVVSHPPVRRNLQPTLVGVGIEGKAPSIPPTSSTEATTSSAARKSRTSRPPASQAPASSALKPSESASAGSRLRASRPPGSKPSAAAYVVPPPSISDSVSEDETQSSPDSPPPVVPGPTPSFLKSSADVPEPPAPSPPPTSEPPVPLTKADESASPNIPTSLGGYKGSGVQAISGASSRTSPIKPVAAAAVGATTEETSGALTDSLSAGSAPTASSPTASSPTASSPTASSPTASSPTASSPTASAPTASAPATSSPAGALTGSAAASGDLVPPAESARPVTTSASDYPDAFDADIAQQKGARAASKAKMMKIAAVLGAVVLLGGGVLSLSGDKETSTAVKAEDAPKDGKPEAKDTGSASAVSAPAPQEAKPAVEEPGKSSAAEEIKPGGEEAAEAAASPEQDPEAKLFRIASVVKGDACEDLLEEPKEHYEKKVSWRGSQAWKLARRALMKGNEKEALNQMCQSAFIEPKGPATLGLARYYLGIRALDQAERWAKRAIEVNPRAQRSAQQLLGDVLCQRGQMKEAREIWLSSFGLKADDERRISAVVRRFEKAARAARRGGDAPLAETHLRRAAAFDPKSADTAADLASILVKNEQPGLAKIWADKALELDSTSKEAKEVLSELSR